ncbi:MAG TPA: HPF/RaiA family ribosome-associated protein [Verrucomicrobiae bacterium]|nr:HPF/RaiA family ribosome-associated protein [Verrucomicrobiae bacterium]
MQISMHINEADLGESVRSYLERRVRFALARFRDRVGLITVRISAEARGKLRCRVIAEMLPFGRIIAEETRPDLFAAVDSATAMISRRFGRQLDRERDSRFGRESVRLAA